MHACRLHQESVSCSNKKLCSLSGSARDLSPLEERVQGPQWRVAVFHEVTQGLWLLLSHASFIHWGLSGTHPQPVGGEEGMEQTCSAEAS